MDSSTSALSAQGGQPASDKDQQKLMQAQSLSQFASDSIAPLIPTQQVSSGNPEQGSIQAHATQNESGEDEIVQPARQEVAIQPAQQSTEVQEIEVKASIPEVAIEKSVEDHVEKAPDTEKPHIPEAVKAAGVTHSGPGIPVDENVFNIKALPMTYEQAEVEEKLHPKLNDADHWLAELVKYVWRKIDPMIGKKKEKN